MSNGKMKKYRLRIPSISLLWSDVIEAVSEDDAICRWAERLRSTTINYYDKSAYEVIKVKGERSDGE